MMTTDALVPRGTLAVLFGLALLVATATTARGEHSLATWKKYQDQLLELGEKDRLLAEFRDRVSKSETALNRFLLGRVHLKLSDADRARPEFERALELDPLLGPARQGLALCLFQRGDLEGALRELRGAIRLDDEDVESRMMLAEILAGKDRLVEADAVLLELLERRPDHIGARIFHALVCLKMKRPKKARDALRVVLRQKPENLEARSLLVECLSRLNDLRGAEAELRKIIAARPDDLNVRYALAQVLYRSRRPDEARKVLIAMLEKAPSPELEKKIREILEVVARAGRGLGDVRNVKVLIDNLESKDVNVRREAMRLLSQLEFTKIPTKILKHILDEDVKVRLMVVRLVGATKDPEDVGLLSFKVGDSADADKSRIVRGACVEALLGTGSPAAVPILLAALKDEDAYVRELAIRSLRLLTGKRFSKETVAVAAAEQVDGSRRAWWGWWTSDRAAHEKILAIREIRRLNLRGLVPYLLALLEDSDPAVFDTAHAAFTAVTKKSFGDVKDGPGDRARIAREAREWWKAGGK